MEKQNKIIGGLTLISLICLVAAYFAPIWWVSLTAPNYPPDAFPDGIRIHFHFDGVYNGCKAAGKGIAVMCSSKVLALCGRVLSVLPLKLDNRK